MKKSSISSNSCRPRSSQKTADQGGPQSRLIPLRSIPQSRNAKTRRYLLHPRYERVRVFAKPRGVNTISPTVDHLLTGGCDFVLTSLRLREKTGFLKKRHRPADAISELGLPTRQYDLAIIFMNAHVIGGCFNQWSAIHDTAGSKDLKNG